MKWEERNHYFGQWSQRAVENKICQPIAIEPFGRDRQGGRLLAQQVEPDLRAGRARDLVQRLVAGPRHDNVIARLERRAS